MQTQYLTLSSQGPRLDHCWERPVEIHSVRICSMSFPYSTHEDNIRGIFLVTCKDLPFEDKCQGTLHYIKDHENVRKSYTWRGSVTIPPQSEGTFLREWTSTEESPKIVCKKPVWSSGFDFELEFVDLVEPAGAALYDFWEQDQNVSFTFEFELREH